MPTVNTLDGEVEAGLEEKKLELGENSEVEW